MKHITTRISEDIHKKIISYSKKQNIPVCTYIRKLIEYGLDVEEQQQNISTEGEQNELPNITEKINRVIIETLLLSRFILKTTVDKKPGETITNEHIENMLKLAKETAKSYSF